MQLIVMQHILTLYEGPHYQPGNVRPSQIERAGTGVIYSNSRSIATNAFPAFKLPAGKTRCAGKLSCKRQVINSG